MACQTCRSRKVKCDRARPRCRNCAQRSLTCVYQGERIKRCKYNVEASQMRSRPQLLRRPNSPEHPEVSPENRNIQLHHDVANKSAPERGDSNMSPAMSNSCITVERQQPTPDSRATNDTASNICRIYDATTNCSEEDLLNSILAQDRCSAPKQRNPAVWIRTEVGDEYTGPSSGISALSDQFLVWFKQRNSGCGCLCDVFKQLRNTLLKHLRQPKCMAPGLWSNFQVHAPEMELPSQETILDYVEAYFSDVQVLFPVLDRERFDAQLIKFRSGLTPPNPSWKALLFAVLASGCRAALSDETAEAFQKSASQAWSYFVSALSHEQMLVHVATDLTAVQALTVMTVFAQGMSSPQRLEYTLCSAAVHCAYSLSLNRDAPDEWGLTDSEKTERNRAFWVLYCIDKSLALRCGRPSMIDDAEIGCVFPRGTTLPSGTPVSVFEHFSPEFDFFLCFTQFARICGKISRKLYSAFALSQYCTDVLEVAKQLIAEIQSWRSTIPATSISKPSLTDEQATSGLSRKQLLVLQLSYYYALCAVYRRFNPIFCHSDENEMKVQNLLQGVATISQVDAARSMVLLTKHLDVESYSPGWLVFYYPMTALITLFVHIICNPSDTLAARNIALMEVAVGFFGRLEYVAPGEAGFTPVREFARQARFIVNKTLPSPCHCETDNNESRFGPQDALNKAFETFPRHSEPSGSLQTVGDHGGESQVSGIQEANLRLSFPNAHALQSEANPAILESNSNMMMSDMNSVFAERQHDIDTNLLSFGQFPNDPWLNIWPSPSEMGIPNSGISY